MSECREKRRNHKVKDAAESASEKRTERKKENTVREQEVLSVSSAQILDVVWANGRGRTFGRATIDWREGS